MKEIWKFIKPLLLQAIKYFISILIAALGISSLGSCTTAYRCTTNVDKMYVSPSKICDTLTVDNRLSNIDIRADTIGYDLDRQVEANNLMQEALKYLKDVGIRVLGVSNY